MWLDILVVTFFLKSILTISMKYTTKKKQTKTKMLTGLQKQRQAKWKPVVYQTDRCITIVIWYREVWFHQLLCLLRLPLPHCTVEDQMQVKLRKQRDTKKQVNKFDKKELKNNNELHSKLLFKDNKAREDKTNNPLCSHYTMTVGRSQQIKTNQLHRYCISQKRAACKYDWQ